jgi:hypothetical protein
VAIVTDPGQLEQISREIARLDDEELSGVMSLVEELLNDNPLAVAVVDMLGEIPWGMAKPPQNSPPQANCQGPIPATKPPGLGIPISLPP